MLNLFWPVIYLGCCCFQVSNYAMIPNIEKAFKNIHEHKSFKTWNWLHTDFFKVLFELTSSLFLFFICYWAALWSSLHHYHGDIFDLKVTGSLLARLSPYAGPSTFNDLSGNHVIHSQCFDPLDYSALS